MVARNPESGGDRPELRGEQSGPSRPPGAGPLGKLADLIATLGAWLQKWPTVKPGIDQRVRSEPTSGLWFFALVALALLSFRGGDPGVSILQCPSGSLRLPELSGGLAACTAMTVSGGFVGGYGLAVLAYSWFFRECARWVERCLNWDQMRRIARRSPLWLIAPTAAVDVLSCLLLAIPSPAPWVQTVTIVSLVARYTLLTLNLLIAGTALFVGARRFALPWTVPPTLGREVVVPSGRPRPIRADRGTDGVGSWFRFPVRNPSDDEVELQLPRPADYGIGLSGGGVRSAAFCSGVLQALAGTPWSPGQADYLATVSGGGYVGVSSQIMRRTRSLAVPLDPFAAQAPETTQLHERQRYLGDDALSRAQLLLALINGLVLNAALIVGPLVLAGLVVSLLPDLPAVAVFVVSLLGAICLAVAAALLWLTEIEGRGAAGPVAHEKELYRARFLVGALVIAGVLLLAAVVPFDWPLFWIPVLLLLAGYGCYRLGRATERPVLVPPSVLFVAGWVSIGLLIVCAAAGGGLGNPTSFSMLAAEPGWLVGIAAGAAVLGICWLCFDQTSWSPHPYYKARLARTFAMRRILKRGSDGDDLPGVQPLLYDEYTYLDQWAAPVDDGPTLLICATANADDATLPPRPTKAVPFVFAHDLVGSPELGWWTTTDFRRCLGRRLAADGTLQAATAISGAAVAPGLGNKGRIPSVGTALALVNARLGVWLPNPNSDSAEHDWPEKRPMRIDWNRRRRPNWLWREVAGFLPSTKPFIYVSDGGHLDNLGLLELLRRRSRIILIADASADEELHTTALDGVCELARGHLGIKLERPATSPLNTASGRDVGLRGVATDCVEVIPIKYSELPEGLATEDGLLVVAKARFAETLLDRDTELAALVEPLIQKINENRRWWRWRKWPWNLQSLPTTPTVNQWLTDDQFSGYVTLGNVVGQRAVALLNAQRPAGARPAPRPLTLPEEKSLRRAS